MADIRIKDLTTLESASLTGDVFVIDGTTGTRKLSAFSPAFGGNATVTGTLTTNGGVVIPAAGSISTLTSTNATHVANATWGALSQGYGTTADWSVFNKSQGTVMYVPTGTSNLFLYGKLDANTLSVYSTTASTTTSSGALVVSGGVGVGGAINAGGAITSNNGSGSGLLGMRSSSGNASYVFWSETGVSDRGILGFNNGSSTLSYRSGASSFSTGTEVFSITSAGVVSIPATTASTSTSSGALVVSGGVGVAGAIYLGGILVSSGSSGGLATESRDGSGYRTTWYNPTGDDMQLDFAGIGTKFTITSAGDTTIAGKITTSAPTGGAGAWELGTYSSTAPSATGYVTIEIGGTVYKLLASNV